MARNPLQLPVIQNWSCHNCGGCCREHMIEITEDEKKRIDRQGWTSEDGIPAGVSVTQSVGKGRYRLTHQADGACIFLDSDGLCRIHAKFGEPAKPLACRVYPFAFHPAGNQLAVGLRFSCPSVVQNLGQRVVDQTRDLQHLASQVVPDGHRMPPPPAIHGDQCVEWPDFHRFIVAFDESLTDDAVDFATQLMRVLSWLELVEQSQFETIRGPKLQDFLNLVTKAAARAQPDSDLPVLQPSRTGRTMFRQIVAQLLRHDTEATVKAGVGERFRQLMNGIRFTTGIGSIPPLPDPVSAREVFGTHNGSIRPGFAAAEPGMKGRTPEIDRLMSRYFRVKIQALHFCGAANFGLSLVEGFRSLALMYPATLWVARIRALSHGRDVISPEDAQAALTTVDHNYTYSPVFGMSASIRRLRILGQLQQVTRLCGWYSL
ncbi:MAG: YkgJ family cysteine cluster protein [Planctomycetaceae bacterium]|nr:YkgJ family cysteine cluster protein [Planctomycetaceae bacterium]